MLDPDAMSRPPLKTPPPRNYINRQVLRITGPIYGSRNGLNYGWDADNSANTRDRNAGNSLDQRYDTFNHMQLSGANRKWEIGVPNGTYSVHIVAGDPSFVNGIYKINAEGVLAVNGTPVAANPWVEGTVTVSVSDERLTLTNAAGANNNKIDFIDITQLSAAALPRWLPSSTTTAALPPRSITAGIFGELEMEDLVA